MMFLRPSVASLAILASLASAVSGALVNLKDVKPITTGTAYVQVAACVAERLEFKC